MTVRKQNKQTNKNIIERTIQFEKKNKIGKFRDSLKMSNAYKMDD